MLLISLTLFFFISFYRLSLGLYLILALLPTYLLRTQILGIPTTFLELAIYVLVIVWFIKRVRKERLKKQLIQFLPRGKKWINSWLPPISLFFIAALISTIISPDKRLSLGVLKGWFLDPLLFLIIFLDIVKGKKQLQSTIFFLGFCVFWVSLFGIYEYIQGAGLHEPGRLNSVFEAANHAAMLIYPILFLLIGTIENAKCKMQNAKLSCGAGSRSARPCGAGSRSARQFKVKNSKKPFILYSLYFIVYTTLLLALYLTKSYGAYLGFFAGILFICLCIKNKKFKVITILSSLTLILLALSLEVGTSKFQHLLDISTRSALSTRLQIWQTSILMIKENPLLGIGLGNFEGAYRANVPRVVFPPLEWSVPKAHNLYLNIWLEMGFLGLFSFIWLVIIFLKKGFEQLGELHQLLTVSLMASLISILVHGLLDTPYFKNDLALLFWVLLGMMILLPKIRPQRLKSQKVL